MTVQLEPILVLNSGSSSLKLGVFSSSPKGMTLLFSGEAVGIGQESATVQLVNAEGKILWNERLLLPSQNAALQTLTTFLREHMRETPIAVGHRIVHGGPGLRKHTKITPGVLAQLEAAVHFAPLHIPAALSIIRETELHFPLTPQFACFDTEFHSTMPEAATHFPIPMKYFEAGLQRYGFHGLSCESVLRRISSPKPARIIVAHLGGGSSVTAVSNGQSIDTSMGLSPTGGVPMSLRSGDLDPAVLLFLLRTQSMALDDLETLLNHECGLKALSGGEADMQRLLNFDDPAANLAIEIYVLAIRKAIGAYVALLGGVDLLVFTGGIGEHSALIRGRILRSLGFLGLGEESPRVLSLPADEEHQIALHCRSLLEQEFVAAT